MSPAALARRRWFVTAALAALVFAMPVTLYLWGRSSSTFAVRHIVLTGERPAHARAVHRTLAAAFGGTNLFKVDDDRVRAALARYPYVRSVAVDRDFPGTLRVRLSEYSPAALLLSGGRWYVVATEGRVLVADGTAPLTNGSSSASPTVSTSPSPEPSSSVTGDTPSRTAEMSPTPGSTATASGEPGSGGKVAAAPLTAQTMPHPPTSVKLPAGTRSLPVLVVDVPTEVGATITDARVRDALTGLAALPRPLARRAVGAVATPTSIRLLLIGGPTIELGDTHDLAAKMLALQAVLSRYTTRHTACTFIDVSVPGRPLGAPLLPVVGTQTGATGGAPSASPSPVLGAGSTPSVRPSP
jgi:POTRA domain, FtsQ-type